MSWQLRNISETRIGEQPEDTILISGRLHGPEPCNCQQCVALEQTAGLIGELLAPGESRRIEIEGTGLHLQIKRHNPARPRLTVKVAAGSPTRKPRQAAQRAWDSLKAGY
jgi:hypothetical protein